MSSGARVRLTRLRETTLGVAPTPAAMTQVRRTGGSWKDSTTRNPSNEKRPDLMYVDAPREDYNVTGSLEDEWAFDAHNMEVEECLNSAISSTIALTGLTLTAAASDNSLTRSAGSWISDGILAGGIYDFGGLSTNALGRLRVVSVESATKIIVAGATLTNEGPTGSCTVSQGGHNRMGTTLLSCVEEEQYPDIGATELWQMLGVVVTNWEWKFAHPGKVTCSFGKKAISRAYNATTAGNGTVNAYTANRVMNSIDHFTAFREDGTLATTLRVKELMFRIESDKRDIKAAGSLGNVSFGLNRFNVTGTLKIYNSAAARAVGVKAKNDTLTSFAWEMVDADGNVEHHYLPRIHFNEGSPEDAPNDSDVYITIPFIASLDTTVGSIYQRTRFPAS